MVSNLAGSSTNSNSLVNQGMTSKADQKKANGRKYTVTETKNVFPTIATGANPEKPFPRPGSASADFYRYGKLNSDGTYETPPRSFDPFELGSDLSASIRIYGKDVAGKTFKDIIPAYTKFFLENVQENHAERSQIVETFGDFYVFMYGERPPVYNFSGQLINARNASWVTDFMFMYDRFLRGTKCVERNASAIVTYGGRQIEGLILSAATTTNAAIEGAVQFNFSVVVFERKFYNFSPDIGYSTTDQLDLTVDPKFRELIKSIAGSSGEGSSDPQTSKAINETKKNADGGPSKGTVKG